MERVLNTLRGLRAITVGETQRALVLLDGRVHDLLGPGRHWINRTRSEVITLDVGRQELTTVYLEAMLRAGVGSDHLTAVTTTQGQLTLVSWNGTLTEVHTEGRRAVYWTEAGTLTTETVDVSETHVIETGLAQRLMRAGLTRIMTSAEVPAGFKGMLTVNGVFTQVLEAGTYWFWMIGRKHVVKLIDMRQMAHEVTGQEILTKDRVSLRVNLSATYRVTDAVMAFTGTKDFVEALHRALQLAFRKTLGARTLDQLLENKGQVDTEAAEMVRAEMAGLGIEVGEIALKDVILPDEMREILNQVVAAQKEAEANVIRRREETNATRSLLNTAKVMSENPVMLRLKELEALESISGRVGQLTVVNGTEGLMQDLVKLRG